MAYRMKKGLIYYYSSKNPRTIGIIGASTAQKVLGKHGSRKENVKKEKAPMKKLIHPILLKRLKKKMNNSVAKIEQYFGNARNQV